MSRLSKCLLAASATLMLGASPAAGADLVGSDLTAPASSVNNPPRTMTAIDQRAGVLLPLTVPTRGVIVEVKLKHGAVAVAGGISGFSILSGDHPNFTARTSAALPDFAWPVGPADIRSFALNPGVQIASGERLAVRLVSGDVPLVGSSPSGGASIALVTDNHVAGQLTYPAPSGFEVLAQLRVEPDADFDSLGDETQDSAVASACLGLQPTHIGTPGDDVIVGTAGSDVIAAGGGADTVFGRGGGDIICGGDGNDRLKGGAGKDTIFGEAGRDKLRGGSGRDACKGGPDRDSAKRCEKSSGL